MGYQYEMPPDTKSKEKIIGGILDLGQFAFLFIGIGFNILIIILFKSIFGFFVPLIIGLPFSLLGLAFAFLKVNGYSLLKYLRIKMLYKSKIRHYINKGNE